MNQHTVSGCASVAKDGTHVLLYSNMNQEDVPLIHKKEHVFEI